MKRITHNALKWATSAVIAGLLAYLLMKGGAGFSWHRVGDSMHRVGASALWLAGLWVLLQTACQILRLWFLLPRDGRLSLGLVAYAYSVGQWLNSFVPARAGDVIKAAVVSRGKQGAFAENAGVVVADKIVDVASLFIIVMIAGGFNHLVDFARGLPWRFIGVATALVFVTGFLGRARIKARYPAFERFESGLRCLTNLAHSIPALSVSTGSWAWEALAILVLGRAVGLELNFSQGVFCLLVLNLAIAVPVSVANVGTFEASLIFGLSRFGMGPSEALAVAVLHHLLQWAGISSWALGTWLLYRRGNRSSAGRQFRVGSTDKDRAIHYYASLAGRYDESVNRGILKRLRSRERDHVLKFSDLHHPAQSMIDVGCGNGFYALAAKKNGLSVTAVDASHDMALRLRDKVDAAFVADVEQLSLGTTFDRVVCAGVLDFVKSPETAFSNLARLVAPGGRLVVLSPRVGLGGLYYRLEKRLVGIRVNLYHLGWFQKAAETTGLELVDYSFPLISNMAVLFQRPRG